MHASCGHVPVPAPLPLAELRSHEVGHAWIYAAKPNRAGKETRFRPQPGHQNSPLAGFYCLRCRRATVALVCLSCLLWACSQVLMKPSLSCRPREAGRLLQALRITVFSCRAMWLMCWQRIEIAVPQMHLREAIISFRGTVAHLITGTFEP